MAYKVAQLTKSNNTSYKYMIPVTTKVSIVSSPNPFKSNNISTFQDFAIQPINNSGTVVSFSSEEVYYLRFSIYRVPQFYYSGIVQGRTGANQGADDIGLQILLKKEGQDEQANPPEQIGNCTIFKTEQENLSSSFSFVFKPTRNDFDTLIFRIIRIGYDVLENNPRQWLVNPYLESGQETSMSNPRYDIGGNTITEMSIPENRIIYGDNNSWQFCTLRNLIPSNSSWLHFGFQSRPGTLIVVNGEPIIVGRSGIYEINNGTMIKSFMIAAPGGSISNNNIDAFLLDYAYNG